MAEGYHDRKMMKWLPFEALPEQGSYLKGIMHAHEEEAMPSLSQDQLDYLNYRAYEAYMNHEIVDVEYYDNHQRYHIRQQVIGLDFTAKTLIFENAILPFSKVLNIR